MASKETGSYEIPIYLKIENSGVGGETLLVQSGGNEEPGKDNEKAVSGAKSTANAAKAIAIQSAKKVAATALNNYGNITGDYTTQQNIQTTVGLAMEMGAAIAMGGVGIALFAVNKGLEVFNYHSQLKRSEVQAAFKQQRVYAEDNKG